MQITFPNGSSSSQHDNNHLGLHTENITLQKTTAETRAISSSSQCVFLFPVAVINGTQVVAHQHDHRVSSRFLCPSLALDMCVNF